MTCYFPEAKLGLGLYLYGDEDDDDQNVIFAQPDATTGMGTETFCDRNCARRVNPARRRCLIYIYPDVEREQIYLYV